MQIPVIENMWTENKIELQNSDGTIIRLNRCNDYVTGEIDKSHTHENRYKKWNTFGRFNENSSRTEYLRSKYDLKDALWEFHFSWLGKEEELLNLEEKLHAPSMAGINLYTWLKDDMELPLPKEIQDTDNLFIEEGGEVFVKKDLTQGDKTRLGVDFGENPYFKLYENHQKYAARYRERLIVFCPTQNEDGNPSLGDFINWYKDLLFKAYTKWDFRLLYQPYVLTGKYECPFKGRTPEIQEIVAKIN